MYHPDVSRRQRRWTLGVVAAAALLAGAIVAVREFLLNDEARAIPTAEVVDRFRTDSATATTWPSPPSTAVDATITPTTTVGLDTDQTDADTTTSVPKPAPAPAPAVALVEPGVYTYETSGSETIDAIGGTRHDYPDVTTITVLPDGCGVSLQWDALRERWDRWRLCQTEDGIELQTHGAQFHEFFGQSELDRLRCDVGVVLVSTSDLTVDPVDQSCSLRKDQWSPTWTVLERSTRNVAGMEIEVQRVQMRIDDNDKFWEHIVLDWYLAPNGLPVEVMQTKSNRSDTFVGPVRYDESFRLVLTSMEPLR